MIQHQDFIVFNLLKDGTYSEIEMEQNQLGDCLQPEEVLLVIRQDLRRLFIWKGPKSPVRKRFISSRVAGSIQKNLRDKGGRYLKIVSVDAGDESVEFLAAFDLDPYKVTEKLEDMRYIRNTERELMKQEELKKKLAESKANGEEEYWSPLLEEMKKLEKSDKGIKTKKSPQKLRRLPIIPKKSKNLPKISQKSSKTKGGRILMSKNENKRILEQVLLKPPPVNMKRMNIIIGQSLYAPSIKKSMVLGQMVETEKWGIVEPPTGSKTVDLETNKIRVFIDQDSKTVMAVEIYLNEEDKLD
ncbi:MAG: hypothetical protein ACTSWY_07945 [Promethearchaeota archaeon]